MVGTARGGRLTLGLPASGEILCELAPNEWSDWLRQRFPTAGGEVEAGWRFYLTHLDRGGGQVILYLSPIARTGCISEPRGPGDELVAELGPYAETLSVTKSSIGWYPPDAFLDECREQLTWQARAAVRLTQQMDVPVVFTKWHAFDKFYHTFIHRFDPVSPEHHPEQREQWQQRHARMHQIADRAVGEILADIDDRTTLILVSDHGLMPTVRHVWVNNYLAQRGFIEVEFDEEGAPTIDWSRTRAYCGPYTQIWVNLIGRDPDGCVEPGEEYEQVRTEVIEALRELRDPETGAWVFDEVGRVEDFAIYGLWGDRDGDVRFATRPGYSVFRTRELTGEGQVITAPSGQYRGDHGCYRPTTRLGVGSETALFGAIGAGIGDVGWSDAPVKLTDITPTICHLLGVEAPADCEGAVIRRCLA